MEFHEAAEIFPLDEEHIEDLAADIRSNGQLVAIETLDGKIIDGRRRFLACQKAGVEPKVRAIQTSDPVAYVKSLNLERRHLTPSQLSMCAARAAKLSEKYREEARARMRDGGAKGGKSKGKENFPYPCEFSGQVRDQIGKDFGVSGKSVDYATKVLDKAVPEVVQAVDEGRMAVSTAAILATEPEEVQRQEASSPKRRRTYQSVSQPRKSEEQDKENPQSEEQDKENPQLDNRKPHILGVGVLRANDAIDDLMRIPKDDPLRKRGFQIVTDWIRSNS